MDDRKLNILEAALRSVTAYGVRRTSMDDIANEAGISRPAIYQHFRNKEDVIVSCIDLVNEKAFAEAKAASVSQTSVRGRLTSYLCEYMVFFYRLVIAGPHAKELLDVSTRFGSGKTEAAQQRLIYDLNEILGKDKNAETGYILAHCAKGLKYQAPDEATLVSRISFLVERFVEES